MSLIVGIDPGHDETGVVARMGDHLAGAWLVTRDTSVGAEMPTVADLAEVNDTIDEAAGRLLEVANGLGSVLVAVEGLVAPRAFMTPDGKRRLMSPRGLMGTAMVLGAILSQFPAAVLIEPGHNGDGPLTAYPEALRPTRGLGKGYDSFRHLRSAWDIAGGARLAARVRSQRKS